MKQTVDLDVILSEAIKEFKAIGINDGVFVHLYLRDDAYRKWSY